MHTTQKILLLLLLITIKSTLALPKSNSLQIAPLCCPDCSYGHSNCCCAPPHKASRDTSSEISTQHLCHSCPSNSNPQPFNKHIKASSYCCKPPIPPIIPHTTTKPTTTTTRHTSPTKPPSNEEEESPWVIGWNWKRDLKPFGFNNAFAISLTRNKKFMAILGTDSQNNTRIVVLEPPFQTSIPSQDSFITFNRQPSITSTLAISEDGLTLFAILDKDDRGQLWKFTRKATISYVFDFVEPPTSIPSHSSQVYFCNNVLYVTEPEGISIWSPTTEPLTRIGGFSYFEHITDSTMTSSCDVIFMLPIKTSSYPNPPDPRLPIMIYESNQWSEGASRPIMSPPTLFFHRISVAHVTDQANIIFGISNVGTVHAWSASSSILFGPLVQAFQHQLSHPYGVAAVGNSSYVIDTNELHYIQVRGTRCVGRECDKPWFPPVRPPKYNLFLK